GGSGDVARALEARAAKTRSARSEVRMLASAVSIGDFVGLAEERRGRSGKRGGAAIALSSGFVGARDIGPFSASLEYPFTLSDSSARELDHEPRDRLEVARILDPHARHLRPGLHARRVLDPHLKLLEVALFAHPRDIGGGGLAVPGVGGGAGLLEVELVPPHGLAGE